MRIKYDMNDNYFKCYNESQGIIAKRSDIIKNPKIKLHGYIERGFIHLFLIFIILIFFAVTTYIITENVDFNLLYKISSVLLGLIFLYFGIFLISYSFENKKIHSGELEVDAEGIKDYSDTGMVIGFSWNNIKAIVIKKHTITILTDSQIYIFMDIEYKDRLLLAIERYNKDLLIIDKTK